MAFRLIRLSNNFRGLSQRFKSSHATDFKAAIDNTPATEVSVIDNGVRVASESSGGPLASVGVWIDAGARYEDARINGVSNFLEHIIFKGTAKRAQADLEQELESIGARLTATTTREKLGYTATCLSKDVAKVVEILSDVVQNPKLNDADIERERAIILREIEDTQTDIKQVTFDFLHSVAFQGTQLGQSVLGPTDNVKSITKQDLQNYVDSHFKAARVVLAGAGGVDHKQLVSLAEKNLGKLDNTFDGSVPDITPCRFTGSEVRARDDSLPQAHVAIAVESSGATSKDHLPLLLAASVIGQWNKKTLGGEHNATNLASVAATHGLCNSYEAFNINYKDTGLFGIYFECDRLKCEEMASFALTEWMRVCTIATEAEIQRAKNSLITSFLRKLDGPAGVCADIGEKILDNDRRAPLDEIERAINGITSEKLYQVATKYIYNRCPAIAAVGPVENLTDYVRIRSGTYWLRL